AAAEPTPAREPSRPREVPASRESPATRTRGRALLFALGTAAVVTGAVVVLRGRQPQAPSAAASRADPTAAAAIPSGTAEPLPLPTAEPTPAPTTVPSEPAAISVPVSVPVATAPARIRPTPVLRPRPSPRPALPSEVVARHVEPPARQVPVLPTPAPAPSSASNPVPPPLRAPTQAPAPPIEARAPESDPKPAGAYDADRIRDVISRYERAQNTLDADLYARVYPRVNRARVQSAFDEFRSQTVSIDQIRVDVAPGATRATVRFHERRVAVPRVGSEQRMDANRTLSLQKEHDTWVIIALQ
ncbi:MAG: hypothetical protein ABJC07_11940, partial [Acidobacteriota bacterium]